MTRILVVEDDPLQGMQIEEWLEEDGNEVERIEMLRDLELSSA